jgi:hypothetical protein
MNPRIPTEFLFDHLTSFLSHFQTTFAVLNQLPQLPRESSDVIFLD